MPKNNLNITVPHQTILDLLREDIDARFDPRCHVYNPFCPSCVARQALTMLIAAYEESDLDENAQDILTKYISEQSEGDIPTTPTKPRKH